MIFFETTSNESMKLDIDALLEWSASQLDGEHLKQAFISAQICSIGLKKQEAYRIVKNSCQNYCCDSRTKSSTNLRCSSNSTATTNYVRKNNKYILVKYWQCFKFRRAFKGTATTNSR